MFKVGLDIGYSNLVVAYGETPETLNTKVLPVGAGPLELLPQQPTGETASSIQVLIDDERWAAGVEPERLQGWDRELHGDYPSTKSYRALFLAALLLSERETIDMLVTGLPVSQYTDADKVKALVERLKGQHVVTPKRTVTVNDVLVVPQPAGAYMDIASSTDDDDLVEMMDEGRVMVIDPGFFSVDWVLFSEGEVRIKSSGTSLKAMSVVLAEMDRLIQNDHGAKVGIDRIEKALRNKKEHVFLLGQRVGLTDYWKLACERIAPSALVSMRQSMREEGMNVDVVILAGGGAASYKDAAIEIFPRAKTVITEDAVLANGRGFWYCAA
nr:ParM/StbA family protein [Alcaligenes faecalis]